MYKVYSVVYMQHLFIVIILFILFLWQKQK